MRWVLFWLLMVIALFVQVCAHFDWKWPSPEPFSEPWLPKMTESDEHDARAMIENHWPTAGQSAFPRSLHLLWAEGDARVVHAVFDVYDGVGDNVRETRLISYRIVGNNRVQLSPAWALPTSPGFNAADLESALKANRFGKYSESLNSN